MNKRGDISITLLVLGVFAICTLAILSFVLHNRINQGNFADLELAENLSSQAEDFYFYINSGLSLEDAAERIGAEIQDNKIILGAEQIVTTGFIQKKTRKILSIEYTIALNG